jgi:hypothetical protein
MWGRSTWSVDGGVLSRSHPCAQPARQFRVVQGASDRQQAFQLTARTNGLCAVGKHERELVTLLC